MSVDDAKNIYKSAMSDPISHSISVVKSEFKKYCIENDARELLFADTVVKESAWQACFIPAERGKLCLSASNFIKK